METVQELGFFGRVQQNVSAQWEAETAAFNEDRAKYVMGWLKIGIPVFMAAVALMSGEAAFAQTDTPTLDIDQDAIQNGLFTGANIIIGALGTVMFLIAGLTFGGMILRGIINAIGSIRF